MKSQIFKASFLAIVFLGLLFSNCENKTKENVDSNDDSTSSEEKVESIGAIYAATNKVDGNTLVAYNQNSDGSLEFIGEYNTGGKGTGNVEIFEGSKNDPTEPLADGVDPLISAYGVFKTNNNKFILAVNAGDSSVSSMKVNDDHSLELVNTVKAGDKYPLSIASHGIMVYVASSGTATAPPFSGNITGYTIDDNGTLTAVEGSTRDLGARPACVAFTEDGKFLVVNELVTGMIKVYSVTDGAISAEPVSKVGSPHNADKGRWLPIPVGFDITTNTNGYAVLVSEARFLNNKGMLREEKDKVPQSPKYSWQTGSTSSYQISSEGNISLVSGDVMTGSEMEGGQIANCWVEASHDGKTLYAANALSSSISTYNIASDGNLTLSNEKAYKDNSEQLFFSDLFLSSNGEYLNQLIGNQGKILVFKVGEDGGLTEVGKYGNMPEVGCYGVVSL